MTKSLYLNNEDELWSYRRQMSLLLLARSPRIWTTEQTVSLNDQITISKQWEWATCPTDVLAASGQVAQDLNKWADCLFKWSDHCVKFLNNEDELLVLQVKNVLAAPGQITQDLNKRADCLFKWPDHCIFTMRMSYWSYRLNMPLLPRARSPRNWIKS